MSKDRGRSLTTKEHHHADLPAIAISPTTVSTWQGHQTNRPTPYLALSRRQCGQANAAQHMVPLENLVQ